jgi:hypothetical protein
VVLVVVGVGADLFIAAGAIAADGGGVIGPNLETEDARPAAARLLLTASRSAVPMPSP